MAKEETDLISAYRGVFRLNDLIESRLKMFFTSVNIQIVPNKFNDNGTKRISPPKRSAVAWASQSQDSLHDLITSPSADYYTYRLDVDDSFQSYAILASVDPLSFKSTSLSFLPVWRNAILALKESQGVAIIPANVSLNKHSESPNSFRIYYRLFMIFSAYRDSLLQISYRIRGFKSVDLSATLFDLFDEMCWDTFLPNGSNLIKSNRLPLPTTKILNYRVGHFVKKASIFGLAIDGEVIPANDNFILLSYEFKENNLVYNYITIDDSSNLSPSQQAKADYLINAFRCGWLYPPICELHEELLEVLKAHMISIMRSMTGDFLSNLPRQLNSYHPHDLRASKMLNTLSFIDHRGRLLASSASNRFESPVVQNRVFRSEFRQCWSTFIPGSRTQFLQPSEFNELNAGCFIPLKPNASLGISDSSFLSRSVTSRPHIRTDPAIIEYPNVSIPPDTEKTKMIFELTD